METKTKFIVDKIEAGIVVAIYGNQTIELPIKLFPKDIKEGDAVVITISNDELETKKRGKKAKELLNEILGNH